MQNKDKTFNEITSEVLAKSLKCQNIINPTQIQELIIPEIFSGVDVIGSSQTGSGKTLAYLLPLLMKLDKENKNVQAVIITPTHELSMQVFKQAEKLVENAGGEFDYVLPTLIVGGTNISKQIEALKEKPRIVIGSVGRILELNKLKKMSMHFVKTIVMDEGDRLLCANSIEDVKKLIKTTQRDRQLVVISATVEKEIVDLLNEIMKEPKELSVKTVDVIPKGISHIAFNCDYRDKIKVLRKIISAEKIQKAIVFMNKPSNKLIDEIVERLNYHAIKTGVIYGDIDKIERTNALNNFRSGAIKILVSSDLSSRGLDFQGVTHIINYDMPEDDDIYQHRSGRCGRMGESGVCISIFTDREKIFIKKMEKKFGINIELKTVSFGNIVDNKRVNNKSVVEKDTKNSFGKTGDKDLKKQSAETGENKEEKKAVKKPYYGNNKDRKFIKYK